MHAEKRKTRIGHGINEILHQGTAFWNQFIVLASEGNDLQTRLHSTQSRDSIRLQPCTVDQMATGGFLETRFKYQFALARNAAAHTLACPDLASCFTNLPGESLAYLLVIDNAGFRDPETHDARHVRFAFSNSFRTQPFQTEQSISQASPFQPFKGRYFIFCRGNDYLAATLMGNTMVLAVAIHGLPAQGAVPGFERAWFVVQAGMNYAAVVPGLMSRNGRFSLQDDERQATTRQQSPGCCQADNTGAYDSNFTLLDHSISLFRNKVIFHGSSERVAIWFFHGQARRLSVTKYSTSKNVAEFARIPLRLPEFLRIPLRSRAILELLK